MTRTPLMLMALLALGCDPDSNDPGDGGQFGEESEGTGCQIVSEDPVGLDEDLGLGVTAAELVALVEGDFDNTLVWSTGDSAAMALSLSGATNARLLDYEYVDDGSGIEPDIYCPDSLAVDLTMALSTDDGALDEAGTVTVVAGDSSHPSLVLELDAVSGSFDAADYITESCDSLWADLSAFFTEAGVSGTIDGYCEQRSGTGPDGAVSLTYLEIAAF